jgi:hypothetical protein
MHAEKRGDGCGEPRKPVRQTKVEATMACSVQQCRVYSGRKQRGVSGAGKIV